MRALYSDHRVGLGITQAGIALLVALGILLTLLAQFEGDPARWASLSNLALLSYLAAALTWAADTWKRPLGRWVTIALLIVIISDAHLWLGIPGLPALFAVPASLSVAMIGPLAGALVAGGETALLLAWLGNTPAYADRAPIVVALLVIWAVYGATAAFWLAIRALSEQAENCRQQALSAMEEMRDRRAAYTQAVDDLAHANRQLALLNERANRLRLVAEEAQQVKERFVTRVSHEFRTPLNMIIGLVDIMVEHPETYHMALSPSMSDDLKVVHRNCEYLSSLVDDVLDLGRLETDHVALRWEPVQIQSIIKSATEAIQPLLEAKHLALRASIPARAIAS